MLISLCKCPAVINCQLELLSMTYRPLCVLSFCATRINCATEFDSHTDIDLNELSNIVKTLASDEFEGRAPGGRGEEKTVAYLIERFQSLGLLPFSSEFKAVRESSNFLRQQ